MVRVELHGKHCLQVAARLRVDRRVANPWSYCAKKHVERAQILTQL